MGCVPSCEINESSEFLRFIQSGDLRLTRVPLTPHFFPSPNCLAFQQLHQCRESQSAKYSFAIHDVRWSGGRCCRYPITPQSDPNITETGDEFDEEICEEEMEPDPTLMQRCHDDYVFGGSTPHRSSDSFTSCDEETSRSEGPNTGDFFCREPEDLYKLLITNGTVPTMTETNAEMCLLYEEELNWRRARKAMRQKRQQQHQQQPREKGEEESESQPPLPRRFLCPLSSVVLAVMTQSEVDTARSAFHHTGMVHSDSNSLSDTKMAPLRPGLHLTEKEGLLHLVSISRNGSVLEDTAVRVVGCELMLHSSCRGTPWLRGLQTDPIEDAYVERLAPALQRPPVLHACHFTEASLCERAFSHVRMAGFADYAMHSKRAGLTEIIARPVWYLGLVYDLPLLRLSLELLHCVPTTEMSTLPRQEEHEVSDIYKMNTCVRQGTVQTCETGIVVTVRGNRLLFRVRERAARAISEQCVDIEKAVTQPNSPLKCPHIRWPPTHHTLYDYGGHIQIHPDTGALCVKGDSHRTCQRGKSSTRLVFVATSASSMAKGPSEEAEADHALFRDGDLITYNATRSDWERLSGHVRLEDVLLCWIKNIADCTKALRCDDPGWVRHQRGDVVQEGRFYIWSFVHDGMRHFHGVIPKFAKERRRRELLAERAQTRRRETSVMAVTNNMEECFACAPLTCAERRAAEGVDMETKKNNRRETNMKEEEEEETPRMGGNAVARSKGKDGAKRTTRGAVAVFFGDGKFAWNPYGGRIE